MHPSPSFHSSSLPFLFLSCPPIPFSVFPALVHLLARHASHLILINVFSRELGWIQMKCSVLPSQITRESLYLSAHTSFSLSVSLMPFFLIFYPFTFLFLTTYLFLLPSLFKTAVWDGRLPGGEAGDSPDLTSTIRTALDCFYPKET